MRFALAALALSGCTTAPDPPVDPAFAGNDVRTSVVVARATQLSAMALYDHPLWTGGFTWDGAYRLKLDVRRVLSGPDPTGGDRTIEIDTVEHAFDFSGKTLAFLIKTNRSGEVLGFSSWSDPDEPCFWSDFIEGTEVASFFTDKSDDKWCGASP